MQSIIVSSIIAVALIGGALLVSRGGEGVAHPPPSSPVTVIDGKQFITVTAKGGYSPRLIKAKADMPMMLRVETKGTFDCSSALAIPSLGYQKNLPPTGVTEIELPPQKAGSTLRGMCSMGMYEFEVVFE